MLLAIAGPSTVGKDAVWMRLAEELGFGREVPFSTRARRPNEIEGKEYHFITIEQFRRMIQRQEVTSCDLVLGKYYGKNLSHLK